MYSFLFLNCYWCLRFLLIFTIFFFLYNFWIILFLKGIFKWFILSFYSNCISFFTCNYFTLSIILILIIFYYFLFFFFIILILLILRMLITYLWNFSSSFIWRNNLLSILINSKIIIFLTFICKFSIICTLLFYSRSWIFIFYFFLWLLCSIFLYFLIIIIFIILWLWIYIFIIIFINIKLIILNKYFFMLFFIWNSLCYRFFWFFYYHFKYILM